MIKRKIRTENNWNSEKWNSERFYETPWTSL